MRLFLLRIIWFCNPQRKQSLPLIRERDPGGLFFMIGREIQSLFVDWSSDPWLIYFSTPLNLFLKDWHFVMVFHCFCSNNWKKKKRMEKIQLTIWPFRLRLIWDTWAFRFRGRFYRRNGLIGYGGLITNWDHHHGDKHKNQIFEIKAFLIFFSDFFYLDGSWQYFLVK
jgi:hypothetical protein